MSKTPLLILRLEGPLQAWGIRARWDVRDSADEPTKSGLIGLLGCALGYKREDPRLVELDRQLTLGIRVEHHGIPMTDFHTITGILPTAAGGLKGREDDPSTIISPRTYLQDAAFLAVFGGSAKILEQSARALQNPKWPLYLGRKSCLPTRPIFEELTDRYDSILELMHCYLWDWDGKVTIKKLPSYLRCTTEDLKGESLRSDRIRVNPARIYANRRVSVQWVKFPGVKEESRCTFLV
jgi:CRISPR system Cascade subunit CasD